MKKQRGRPSIDDTKRLMEVARKIINDGAGTPRSAIVQTLDSDYSDSNIRRLQRKWRETSETYLQAVRDENKKIEESRVTRTYRRDLSSYPFGEAKRIIDEAFAPIRQAEKIIAEQTKMFRIAQEAYENSAAAQLKKHLKLNSVHQLQEQIAGNSFRQLAEQFRKDQEFVNTLRRSGWF